VLDEPWRAFAFGALYYGLLAVGEFRVARSGARGAPAAA
jgi:hypothetical protein